MKSKCPECQEWEIKKSDRFCSWCGVKLFDVEVKPRKMRFYIDREKGKCFHKNRILLDNRGRTEIDDISTAYDNTLFEISNSVKVLRQGEKKTLEVKLLNAGQIEAGTSTSVLIEIGGQKHTLDTEFYYTPEWTLTLEGEEVQPGTVRKVYRYSDFTEVPFRLEKPEVMVFETEDVHVDDHRYVIEKTGCGDHHFEGVLKLKNEEFIIEREEFVELMVKGKETDYVGRFSFYISLVVPPDFFLVFDGRTCKEGVREEIEVFEGIDNEIRLKIINSSTEPLTIEGIEADPPFNTRDLGLKFPRELPPASDQELYFKLDAGQVEGVSKEASVYIDTREIKGKKSDFLIRKQVAESFDGVLAVDFGTTNTTIAYKTGGEACLVTLEKSSDPEKSVLSPSVIRYDRIVDRIPEKYVIGELARSLMIYYQRSSVKSVKTHLGEKEKIRILPVEGNSGSTEYAPVEVTSHMIKRLIEIAENQLKKKIDSAVITHPSKFTHIQIEELKTAFKEADVDVADVIEEPEATAIDYILWQKGETGGSYVIGVFDCGGGTTDITMMEVLETREDAQRSLDVKVLATDGDRSFGGNDLTDIMADILAEKIKNKQMTFDTESEDVEGLRFFYSVEDQRSEEMIKCMTPRGIDWGMVVLQNRYAMWELAEDCKIELSEKNEIDKDSSFTFIKKDDELAMFNVRFHIKREEFEKRIESKLLEFVEKFKRMERKTEKSFDIIILSGMSSKIPLVYQVFKEHFADKVIYAHDLKKCVVLGAIDYYEKSYAPGLVSLNVNREPQLRSAIGIMITDIDGEKKFHEVFPLGTQILDETESEKKIDLPLRKSMRVVVYRNLGTREHFGEAPEEFEAIRTIKITLPKTIDAKKIKKGEMYMQIDDKFEPKISVKIGDFSKDF